MTHCKGIAGHKGKGKVREEEVRKQGDVGKRKQKQEETDRGKREGKKHEREIGVLV